MVECDSSRISYCIDVPVLVRPLTRADTPASAAHPARKSLARARVAAPASIWTDRLRAVVTPVT